MNECGVNIDTSDPLVVVNGFSEYPKKTLKELIHLCELKSIDTSGIPFRPCIKIF